MYKCDTVFDSLLKISVLFTMDIVLNTILLYCKVITCIQILVSVLLNVYHVLTKVFLSDLKL